MISKNINKNSPMNTYEVAGNSMRGFQENGEVWFIGKDISKALGTSPTNLQWNLDDKQEGYALVPSNGGKQSMKVISSSGLISLIFRSKRPEAKQLREWAYGLTVPYICMRIAETGRTGVDANEEREARQAAFRAMR